jgi:hypothetical protein
MIGAEEKEAKCQTKTRSQTSKKIRKEPVFYRAETFSKTPASL